MITKAMRERYGEHMIGLGDLLGEYRQLEKEAEAGLYDSIRQLQVVRDMLNWALAVALPPPQER